MLSAHLDLAINPDAQGLVLLWIFFCHKLFSLIVPKPLPTYGSIEDTIAWNMPLPAGARSSIPYNM